MSALIITIFVLTGPYAGKTVKLGKFQFVNGELTVNATPEDTGRLALALERNWQAYPVGHPKLKKEKANGQRSVPAGASESGGNPDVSGGVQPNGEGSATGSEADDGSGASDPSARPAPQLAIWDGQQSVLISTAEEAAAAFAEATEESPIVAQIDLGQGVQIDVEVVGFDPDGGPILSEESLEAFQAATGGVPAQDADDDSADLDEGHGVGTGSVAEPPAGEPVHEPNEKLLRALRSLDPSDDNHWTRDGKPAMSAVGVAYGSEDVTRADVEAVAPGFNRAAAQK